MTAPGARPAWVLPVVLTVAVLGAVAALLVALWPPPDDGSGRAARPPGSTTPAVPAPDGGLAASRPDGGADADATQVELEIRTMPAGAIVLKGDVALGQTPMVLVVRRGRGPLQARFQLEGHTTEEASFDLDADPSARRLVWSVALEPLAVRPLRYARPAPRTGRRSRAAAPRPAAGSGGAVGARPRAAASARPPVARGGSRATGAAPRAAGGATSADPVVGARPVAPGARALPVVDDGAAPEPRATARPRLAMPVVDDEPSPTGPAAGRGRALPIVGEGPGAERPSGARRALPIVGEGAGAGRFMMPVVGEDEPVAADVSSATKPRPAPSGGAALPIVD